MESTLRDSQLRVLWISRLDYQENSGVGEHKHDDFYQFIYIVDGVGEIKIDGINYKLNQNDAVIIPKKAQHSFRFSESTTTIDLKFTILNQHIEQLLVENACPYIFPDIVKVKEVFKLSCQKLHSPHELLSIRIDILFKELLLAYFHDNTFQEENAMHLLPPINAGIGNGFKFVQYLENNYHENITLEDISREFHFHPHYVIELFRKTFKTTPIAYLQMIRIEKSKELLEFTNTSVNAISGKVGLSGPYYSRLFKEKVGISPTTYRENARTVVGKHIILEQDFVIENQPPISNLNEL